MTAAAKPNKKVTETLAGTLREQKFHNNGFFIGRLESGESIKGTMLEPAIGANYLFTGYWESAKNARWGDTFVFDTYEMSYPTDMAAIHKYLTVHCKHLGPVLAERVCEAYGESVIEVLKNDPERVAQEIPGLSHATATAVSAILVKNEQSEQVLVQLNKILVNSGIGKAGMNRIIERWGHEAVAVITANPFHLTSIHGIGFTGADKVRHNIGMRYDHPLRIQNGVLHILNEAASGDGHTFMPRPYFLQKCSAILGVPPEMIEGELTTLQEVSKIVVQPTMIFGHPGYNISLADLWNDEASIADQINMLLAHPGPRDVRDLECVCQCGVESYDERSPTPDPEDPRYCLMCGDEIASGNYVSAISREPVANLVGLAEDQKAAMTIILGAKFSVLQGGPGTGKTYTIKRIIDSFPPGTKILLAAPTGKAAKRMMEQSGRLASTIHRALEPMAGEGGKFFFGCNAHNPIDADVIVIDEASMLPASLMASLMDAVAPGTRVILVGDTNQLPSVGAGNILRDIIDSGRVPVAELTIIKRQEEGTLIVHNCHAIKNGNDIVIDNNSKDFFWLQESIEESIVDKIVGLLRDRLPMWVRQWQDGTTAAAHMLRDVQVIAPLTGDKKANATSCKALNEAIQAAINPNPIIEGCKFRTGDKVIQTKNNYSLGIFNGDIGIMHHIDMDLKEYTVVFDAPEREVVIAFRASELKLAYAITCHRFQGSESRIVIIPIHKSQGHMIMQRPWLYTAVSRAREVCIIVGQAEEVPKIVHRVNHTRRNTHLRAFLCEAAPGTIKPIPTTGPEEAPAE